MVRFIKWSVLGLVALVGVMAMSIATFSSVGVAQATGGPPECDDPGLEVEADDQGGASGFSIGIAGEIVGLCVQTEGGHSSLISEDGSVLDDCSSVSGLGSSQVLITRSADCAALTHVDVFYLPVPDEPVVVPETPSDADSDVETPVDEQNDEETEQGAGTESPLLTVT